MPPTVDLESLVADQRETIKQMQEEMRALAARVPPAPEPEYDPKKFYPFPAIVYKAGHKKNQIDHPGNVTLKVASQREMDAAMAGGWSKTPLPFDYDKLEPEPEPVKKGARK
jgi:hypothetical protein